jgi:ribosomal protein L37AE/L43A
VKTWQEKWEQMYPAWTIPTSTSEMPLGRTVHGRPTDIHHHKCAKCSHKWRHDGFSKAVLRDEHAAHCCPNCGEHQSIRYSSRRRYA